MSVQEVGAFEAKTHLSALLDQVKNGETIFITKHGKRVAELRPVQEEEPSPVAGTLKGKIWMAPDFDAPFPDLEENAK